MLLNYYYYYYYYYQMKAETLRVVCILANAKSRTVPVALEFEVLTLTQMSFAASV